MDPVANDMLEHFWKIDEYVPTFKLSNFLWTPPHIQFRMSIGHNIRCSALLTNADDLNELQIIGKVFQDMRTKYPRCVKQQFVAISPQCQVQTEVP